MFVEAKGLPTNFTRWSVWRHLSNYTEKEREHRLETYFKFVFVWEPLERLLSAYKDRLIKHARTTEDVRKVIVQFFRPWDFEPKGKNFVRFGEFIQYLSDNEARNMHWRQYEKLCHPCVTISLVTWRPWKRTPLSY